MKKYYLLIIPTFILGYFIPLFVFASTTLDTAVSLIKSGSGVGTNCNNTTCNLDTFTFNPNADYNDTDKIIIYYNITPSAGTSINSITLTNTTNSVNMSNMSNISNTLNVGTCTIQDNMNTDRFFTTCNYANNGGTSTTSIVTSNYNYNTSTKTIGFTVVTTGSRQFDWNWSVYLLKGVNATTSITEEDNLDHLPSQTSNSGKFLTTNGTTASWGTPTDTGCTAYSCLTGLPSLFSGAFSALTGKPTTISGYGITDAYPLTGNPAGYLTSVGSVPWGSITSTPTTLSGYGITDGVPSNRTITIDGVGLDLSVNRSWTTSGGGGCTDFSCLTGTDDILSLNPVTIYAILALFMLVCFGLTTYITIYIIKKIL